MSNFLVDSNLRAWYKHTKLDEVIMFTFEPTKLKEIMKARGWTVEHTATIAGLTRTSLQNMMSGRHIPTVATLLAICNASGTQPGYFFAQTVEDAQQ